MNNRKRIDPEEPIKETGIYRDKWERLPLSEDSPDMRMKDVIDTFNYVSEDEYYAARLRGYDLEERRTRGDHLGW